MEPRRTKALATLLAQINAAYPNRSKASDGWIGDTAHAGRKSDHNPDDDGTVDAIDITHDPRNGPDIARLAEALIAGRDKRVSYIIANSQIIAGRKGPSPWKRRKYSGANKHTKHLHISVLDEGQDDTTPWNIAAAVEVTDPKQSILKRGSSGPFVSELQANLARLGYAVKVDGDYGEATERAVKALQRDKGLNVDGWAGPRTIDAIGKALAEKAAKPKIEEAKKTVPPSATDEVEEKTGLWQKITGFFGAGIGGSGLLFGLDWRVVVAIGATTVLLLILLLIFKRQIIAAFRDINAEVRR